MEELIASFTTQLKQALEIGREIEININNRIDNVLITGLGGSGIGGKIASGLLADYLTVPVTTNNDYQIPNWVNENTLVIANSYSGNTEETLEALNHAQREGAQIVCITSGGQLEQIALRDDHDLIKIPGGNPPRAALAYSLVQQLFVLRKATVAQIDFEDSIEDAIVYLTDNEDAIKTRAKDIAQQLLGKTAIIYSSAAYEGVAVRLRQQINENAKELCWHHVLPEMNHNELVGWAGGNANCAVILMKNEDDYARTVTRMNISKSIIKNHTSTFIEIEGKGNDIIERSLYLIHLGDWVSEYLAQLKEIDSVEVDVIDYLKGELAKQ